VAMLARTWERPASIVRTSRSGTTLVGAGAALALGLGLGLLALGPGLRRGFLLSYDMVFVPREPFSAALPGPAPPRAVPSDLVIAAASRALPADIAQKVVLLSIFMLACSGAAALLDREPLLARLAAGAFYAWNPYVGERLIIGQWALLLGYAGLPWVLRAVLAPDLTSRRGAARLGLALLPAVIGGFTAMAITALIVVPVALLAKSARRAAVALAALAAGCLPWFFPSLLHAVYVDPASVAAFAARADTPFGSIGSLLMLGGAWNAQTVPTAYGGPWSVLWLAVVIVALAGYLLIARGHALAGGSGGVVPPGQHRWPGLGVAGRAVSPGQRRWPGLGVVGRAVSPGQRRWPGLGVVGRAVSPGQRRWPGLGVVGRAVSPGQRRWPGLGVVGRAVSPGQHRWPGLGVAAVAGLVIACLGVTAFGQDLLRSAISAFPGFAVLRDAQQFAAPLALAEAVGFGLAVAWAMNPRAFLIKRAEPERPARPDPAGMAIGVLAILAPVLLLPGLAWGAAGRLRPAWYPGQWLAAARVVDASAAPGSILLLPWETYRTPSWNHGEVVLDPWTRLLSRPLIWNDGTRVGTVELAPDDPRAGRLDGAIRGGGPLTAALRAAGVRFVLDDAEPDRLRFGARLPGAVIIINQAGLAVYQLPAALFRTS